MSTKKLQRIKGPLIEGIYVNQVTKVIIPQVIVYPTNAMPRPCARKIPLLSYNQETMLPRAQESNTNSVIPIGSRLGQTSALKLLNISSHLGKRIYLPWE
jgi:hypothetical protein